MVELGMIRMAMKDKSIVTIQIRRALFKLVMLIIGISAFLPSIFLETNMQYYEDDAKKDFAIQAINMTTNTFKNTLDQFLIVSYRVESIEIENGVPLSSVIIAYTVFGIPYAEVMVDKDGVIINKKFFSEN